MPNNPRFLPSKLIVANWKMNGSHEQLIAWLEQIGKEIMPQLGWAPLFSGSEQDESAAVYNDSIAIAICPPALFLGNEEVAVLSQVMPFSLGAQSCHHQVSGAHTGDISAQQIKDCGAQFVIVGHSERRAAHGESNAIVRAQAEAAQSAGLMPIICLGESYEQREQGQAEAFVSEQLSETLPTNMNRPFAIAYEPIWAIGTRQSATNAQIVQMHQLIYDLLPQEYKSMPLLYGGSVNADNAAEILALPHVNGALVGGASLNAKDFAQIIQKA